MPEEATLDAFVKDDGEDGVEDDVAADADADTTSEASVDTDTTSTTEERVDTDTTPATEERVETDANGPEMGERSVEPSPVTSSWTGDEGVCSSCGEPAVRLWQDGSQRVCEACKQWTSTGEDVCGQ